MMVTCISPKLMFEEYIVGKKLMENPKKLKGGGHENPREFLPENPLGNPREFLPENPLGNPPENPLGKEVGKFLLENQEKLLHCHLRMAGTFLFSSSEKNIKVMMFP